MTMARVVAAEALDTLAPHDPAAIRSRRDLRRIHRVMGTQAIVTKAMREMLAALPVGATLRVLELGAGDGQLMLGVGRALAHPLAHPLAPPLATHRAHPPTLDSAPRGVHPPAVPRPGVELTLLDRQRLVAPATIAGYAELGWAAVEAVTDVADWARAVNEPLQPPGATPHWDVIVANLFMHHFEGAQLARLLTAIAQRCEHFFACEPQRAWLALAGSHLVGAIGANPVTRQDAVLSVHAGFRADELTALWPGRAADWTLREYSAGLFSHCFRAERVRAPRTAPAP